MVDIATVSVVSSGHVALGTVAANIYGGDRQRKHGADLDFERRVWERKSEALFEVIDRCGRVIDGVPLTESNRVAYALDLSKPGSTARPVEAGASRDLSEYRFGRSWVCGNRRLAGVSEVLVVGAGVSGQQRSGIVWIAVSA